MTWHLSYPSICQLNLLMSGIFTCELDLPGSWTGLQHMHWSCPARLQSLWKSCRSLASLQASLLLTPPSPLLRDETRCWLDWIRCKGFWPSIASYSWEALSWWSDICCLHELHILYAKWHHWMHPISSLNNTSSGGSEVTAQYNEHGGGKHFTARYFKHKWYFQTRFISTHLGYQVQSQRSITANQHVHRTPWNTIKKYFVLLTDAWLLQYKRRVHIRRQHQSLKETKYDISWSKSLTPFNCTHQGLNGLPCWHQFAQQPRSSTSVLST